jgi:dTDP-4-amino-4,6-dideoxygalactose transaminase
MEFRDLKTQYLKYKNQIDKAIMEVFDKTNFISGDSVKLLEDRLAEYVGVEYCISCANGTDAMSLVLTAWGIGKGDAVFVPDFTFFATAEVVAQLGAIPVFVDVDQNTFNIDTKHLKKKVEDILREGIYKPKAIIPVDLFGLLADYEVIQEIAEEYNLLVLEDGAQGFGAEHKGKKACSFGDAATTSFFPAKPLGCYGDGGAIFTNDPKLAEVLLSLRVHGKGTDKYDNVRIGFNSRLDTIQAAVLNVKLDAFIDHELEDVNRAYGTYNKMLENHVDVPIIPAGYTSSFAQYTIKLKTKDVRDGLQQYLRGFGIPSMIYYEKGMHCQTAFQNLKTDDNEYPITNYLCERVLSLPMHPYIENDEIIYISEKIIDYLSGNV